MRRGSVQTWEPLARRQSSQMAQFASSRSEFMTSDLGLNDIEYERKGGFFMTHKKTAFVISAFVVIIIAAGFVGAYIGSTPKEKVYDTNALIEADIGCDHVETSKFSLSHSISPSRYKIEISPFFDTDETMARLQGHVKIEFRYNGTANLAEIVLNARHVNLTRVKLISGLINRDENSAIIVRRRRFALANDEQAAKSVTANTSSSTVANTTIASNATTETVPMTLKNVTEISSTPVASLKTDANSTQASTEGDRSSTTRVPTTVSAEVKLAKMTENVTQGVFYATSTSNSSLIKNEPREIPIRKNETDKVGGFLVLYPEKPLTKGDYYLEIDYEVPMHGYVFYSSNKTRNGSGTSTTSSHFGPTRLANFFPVFDDARMKARFSLTLSRPHNMMLHSNMPVLTSNSSTNEWEVDIFQETPRIAPENLAVIATKRLTSLGKNVVKNVTINFWDDSLRTQDPKYLFNKTDLILNKLFDLFKVKLTIPKLDIIGIEHGDFNAAFPGLIIIQESLFAVNEDSPEVTKVNALTNLIKLLAEQWLGGLVNSQNSSDVWILESSLLYLQHQLLREINPSFNHSTFVMDVQPDVFEAAGYTVSRSLKSQLEPRHSNSFYKHEAYATGACLIRMLHGALRKTDFRAGYGSFLSRWSGDNADVTAFWIAMTTNYTADERPEGEPNLPEIMNLWSTLDGYPVVTVTRNYKTGSAIVRQARFSYDKLSSSSQQFWHIPLTWISSDNNETSFKWIKNQAETTLELQASNATENNETWIVFNPDKLGLYRVHYDQENWRLIADALRENLETFSPATRASLVDDVFSQGFVRSIPYSVVFDVINYLSDNETEPEVWTYLLHHAIKLNLVLYDSPNYFEYKDLMTKFVAPLFDRVGLKIKEGPRLTVIAHQLASMFDYPAYVSWAKKSYAGFEKLPGLPIQKEVPSYLHDSLLCAFAKLNHELGWQWWEQKFDNVTNREERNSLLSSLACFQVPSMLQAVLNEIVYSNSFNERDALVILKSFSVYPAAAQTALKFVETNWKNITRRYSKSCRVITAFLDASSTSFTAELDIEEFQSFKMKNYESLKKVGYATALLEAKASASLSFIKSLPDNPISVVNSTTIRIDESSTSDNPNPNV